MKKPVIICLILLLALGLVGPAYAQWSNSIAFKQKIATGTVSLGIRGVDDPVSTSQQAADGSELVCQALPEGKYMGSSHGSIYYEGVDVTVSGNGPWSPGCVLEIANTGTVPAKVKGLVFSGSLTDYIQSWTLSPPEGYSQMGEGLIPLLKAVGHVNLERDQRMRLEMQFLFSEEGPAAASGSIKVESCPWNKKLPEYLP